MQREIIEPKDFEKSSQTINIVTQERTKELKPYNFNVELFDLLKGSDYTALKRDIKQKGVKVELHILPDKTVICGHQRLRIAKELDIPHLRCKTVIGLDTEEQIKEYVILDNFLRRQLTPEKQAILRTELYNMNYRGKGKRSQDETLYEDVFEIVAKQTNCSRATVARDVQYVKAIEENPEYQGKTITVVLQDVKRKKNEKKIQEEAPKLELEGIYKTIVIDPPWEAKANPSGYARPDYKEMSIDEIDNFYNKKIKEHIDENAHIYMWVINNRILEGFELLGKWGFDYKNIITWVKTPRTWIGLGNYFRNNTEHILFGVKGKLALRKNNVGTWFEADRLPKHSAKPDVAYHIIEAVSHPPYLDVFGRNKRKNWKVIGEKND